MLIVILLALIVVSQLMVGLLVYIEGRRTSRVELKLFAALSLSTLLWTIFNAFLSFVDSSGNATNVDSFTIANQIAFWLGSLSLFSIFLFSLYYPVHKKIHFFHKIILGLGLLLTVLSPLAIIAGDFTINPDGGLTYRYGSGAFLIGLYALFVVADVYFDDVRVLRSTSDVRLRKQAKTLLAGLTLTIIHTILFIIVLPSIFGQSSTLYAIGYAAPFYLITFTVYGLLRQGLFDIRLIVARSVAYIFSVGSIGVIFSLLLFVISGTIVQDDSPQIVQQLGFVFIAIVSAISYQPLKRFFDKATNKIFYKDAYDTQILLNQLNAALVSTINLEEMLKLSSGIIAKHLKASFIAFDIKNDNEEGRTVVSQGIKIDGEDLEELRGIERHLTRKVVALENSDVKEEKVAASLGQLNVAVLSNLVVSSQAKKGASIGYLMIGSKKSGYLYNKGDLRVIQIISDELVIAIQNALRFEEIQNFAATLQEKVDEATHKLRRTNEKLRQLDETKDDFISMASHQLRTPLTSVKGYVSMVLDGDAGKITAQQQKLLEQAFTSSQRMVYLIADLLNVSRLKTGKFVIEAKPTNLAEIVESEIEQLKETAKGRGLKLEYEQPKSFPSLNLDETKIRQVIMNFSDNAIYYTPTGGTIRVNLIDKPESIELTVVDNGIGVPKTEQHHLFNKFYRAGNAKKARPDGTGLGLFMAQKVIVAQGGAIIFHSEENKGSTFGFSFPKAKLLVK